MTTGWGIDPLKDVQTGAVLVGTTAADLRQIQGGLYTPGLISGGKVTRSATALTYTVSAGVAAFPIVEGTGVVPQTVLGPIPATTLTTTVASSGTRLDMIYAQQRTVAVEGDPNIVVAIGTSLPARAVLLDAYIMGTTTPNTNAATRSANIKYSIPYGASLGRLVNATSMFNSPFGITSGNPTGRSTVFTNTFYVPTDRLFNIDLRVTLSALRPGGVAAVGFDNTAYCEAGYDVFVDGTKYFSWSTMGLHQAWQEINWSDDLVHTAGEHTIKVEHFRAKGPGTPAGRALAGAPYAKLRVTDVGPVP